MSQPAIRIENLGKRYLVDHESKQRGGYKTLRESIVEMAKAPLKRLQARVQGSGFRAQDGGQGRTREEFWALKDVSFEVQPGEVVGIIGRNGAGKSTLLKILSQITKPTTGRVTLNGRVGSLLEVGTGFHPELTGRENIYLNGSILGMKKTEIDRKFDEIVAFAEIDQFLDTPVKRYSSGMYVRLAFAVAAHLEPEILIIDEVLAVGDAGFQKKCLAKMRDVAKHGSTVLFVSHNMATVSNLCSRAALLTKGTILAQGSAQSIVNEYHSTLIRNSQSLVDLNTYVRSSASQPKVKLTGLEWLGSLPIQHGETFRVRIHFKTTSAVEDVAIGIGISTADGNRFFTLDTDFEGQRRSFSRATTGSVDVFFPNFPIAPGVYAVDIGARSGDRVVLDLVQSATLIDVIAGPNTPSMVSQYPNVGVRMGGDWQWMIEA